MMTLAEWLNSNGMTQVAFAARLGVPQSSVSRWCDGRIPSARNITRIAEETGGAVGPASWFPKVAA